MPKAQGGHHRDGERLTGLLAEGYALPDAFWAEFVARFWQRRSLVLEQPFAAPIASAGDDTGSRLRGHQITDGRGGYTLRTVVPRAYPGRTRHVHVKVRASGFRPLRSGSRR